MSEQQFVRAPTGRVREIRAGFNALRGEEDLLTQVGWIREQCAALCDVLLESGVLEADREPKLELREDLRPSGGRTRGDPAGEQEGPAALVPPPAWFREVREKFRLGAPPEHEHDFWTGYREAVDDAERSLVPLFAALKKRLAETEGELEVLRRRVRRQEAEQVAAGNLPGRMLEEQPVREERWSVVTDYSPSPRVVPVPREWEVGTGVRVTREVKET